MTSDDNTGHDGEDAPVTEPFSEWLDQWKSSTLAELEQTDVAIGSDARADAKTFDELEKDRLEQASKLRPFFFWLAGSLTVATVLTSCLMILIIAIGNGNISDALGVAFVSGLAVETLGILTIVGRYLFTPHPPRQTREDPTIY